MAQGPAGPVLLKLFFDPVLLNMANKVTKVSFNEKFSIQVKGKQPKDFKKSKIFYLIS